MHLEDLIYTSYYNAGDSSYNSANEVTATCKMTIRGSGNVGIGTTEPDYPLASMEHH